MRNLYLASLVCLVLLLTVSCKKEQPATILAPVEAPGSLTIDSVAGSYYFYVTDTGSGEFRYNDTLYTSNVDTAYYSLDTIYVQNNTTLKFGADLYKYANDQSTKTCKQFFFYGGEYNGVIKYFPLNDSIFSGQTITQQHYYGNLTYSGKRKK